MNLKRAKLLASGIALCGLLALPAGAQNEAGSKPPQSGAQVQQPPPGTIRVRVAVVNAPVVVTNSKGDLVLDLQKDDFHVLDNGVPQTIDSADLGGQDLSAVLLFENSSRIGPVLPTIQKSAILFTQTIVGPSGRAAVLSYDSRIGRLLPFSTDHDKIEKAIADLQPGDSGARLYDALAEAVSMFRDQPSERRRAIVVVGEAKDSGSEERLGEVLRQAQLENVVIYSVGISPMMAALRAPAESPEPPQATPPGTFGMPPFPGTPQTPSTQAQYAGNIDLAGLAEWAVRNAAAIIKDRPLEIAGAATGGNFQSVVKANAIEKAIDNIGGEVNAQYLVSYHPTGSDAAGYHEIQVTVDKPGVTVRTRPGYYLEANSH